MSKHQFNLELLRADDNREWTSLYNKLKGMLKSKSFTSDLSNFSEDVFNDTIIIIRGKLDNVNTTGDLINLAYKVYTNQMINFYKKESKFASRSYIHTDEGMQELSPDHLGSSQNEQDAQHDAEQLEVDLEALKERFKEIQEKLNKNNHAKHISLYDVYLEYVNNHEVTLEKFCEEIGVKNTRNWRNINLLIQKEFGLEKPIKKAKTPFEELKASARSQRKKRLSNG